MSESNLFGEATAAETETKEKSARVEKRADLKCFRGLDRFLVRTLPKVTCVVFGSAITCNALKLLLIV